MRDFLYDVFHLQGKTDKTKWKINKLLRNIFVTSSPKNNLKPSYQNGMKTTLVKAILAWNKRVLIIHLLFDDQNKWQTSRKFVENSRLVVSKFVTGSREYDIKLGNILRYCSPVINQILFLQNLFEPIVDTKKKWELLLSAAVNPIDKVSFWRNLWDTGYWISSGGLNSVPLEFTGKKVLTPVI